MLKDGRVVEITYSKDRVNAGEVLAAVQGQGLGIVDVSTRESSLEDVFLSPTRGSTGAWTGAEARTAGLLRPPEPDTTPPVPCSVPALCLFPTQANRRGARDDHGSACTRSVFCRTAAMGHWQRSIHRSANTVMQKSKVSHQSNGAKQPVG